SYCAMRYCGYEVLRSCPTRRSSDLSLKPSGSRPLTSHRLSLISRSRSRSPRAAFDFWHPQGAKPSNKKRPSPQGLGISKKELLRSEEHTSELQSRENLVCRLLLQK